ncbi:MAG: TIGR01906 family membrane protein [Chloroflexi bacterium HGW-Chloroflexi-5]|jgi:integral membrane protein (TIGR01906 family)|nr:MAG: TIGR01906 family membrane protein [Chloroflexi bacterium HGW-Chloroflexi-5]
MKTNIRIFSVLISIIVPLLLMMTSIRILLNPFFLDYEYNLPNFPADDFGFSKADRLHWGKLSLDYLTNSAGPEFLADLKFEDGDPIYNERELSHMLDVKNLVQLMIKIMLPMAGFLVLAWVLAWRLGWIPQFWKSISQGGWLTLGLIGLVLIGTVINFDAIFTTFHRLFFTGNTWLFYFDDTLIRLFPEKLWSDAFTFMGVFTLAGGVICTFLGARLAHKNK